MSPIARYQTRTLTPEEEEKQRTETVAAAYANINQRRQHGAPAWSNTIVDVRDEYAKYENGELTVEQVAEAIRTKITSSPWHDMHLSDPENSTFKDALDWLLCVTEEDELDGEMQRLWDVADVDRVRLISQ